MASEETQRSLIERYLAAYNGFDVPGMLVVLHPEVEFQNISAGTVTASARGRDEFRRLAEHAVTLFTSRRQTVREFKPEPSGVRLTLDYEGVLATELGPGLRAGDTLRLTGSSSFEFREGLIARIVDES